MNFFFTSFWIIEEWLCGTFLVMTNNRDGVKSFNLYLFCIQTLNHEFGSRDDRRLLELYRHSFLQTDSKWTTRLQRFNHVSISGILFKQQQYFPWYEHFTPDIFSWLWGERLIGRLLLVLHSWAHEHNRKRVEWCLIVSVTSDYLLSWYHNYLRSARHHYRMGSEKR